MSAIVPIRRRTVLQGVGTGLGLAAATGLIGGDMAPARAAKLQAGVDYPYRIYRITYRGRTEVEDGFDDYMASNRVPVDFLDVDANRDPSRLPTFVDQIKSLRPDLVVTWGTTVTLGVAGRFDARRRTPYVNDLPIVFALVSAPVRSGLVPSREQPGRNLTGVVHVVPTVTQVRAMAAYRPFRRLGVLYTPTENNAVIIIQELRNLQRVLGFELIERAFPVGAEGYPSADRLESLLSEIKAEGAEWLYLQPDSFLGTQYDRVAKTTKELGLPCFAATELAISSGVSVAGLISPYRSVGQFAAQKAVEILQGGKKPAQIPIETLRRFSLVINMPVALELAFYPPIEMLDYAQLVR